MDKFKTNLSSKFKWDFSEIDDGEELDEEDKPVIVEIWEMHPIVLQMY